MLHPKGGSEDDEGKCRATLNKKGRFAELTVRKDEPDDT